MSYARPGGDDLPPSFFLLRAQETALRDVLEEIERQLRTESNLRGLVALALRIMGPKQLDTTPGAKDTYEDWRRPSCGPRCLKCGREERVNEVKKWTKKLRRVK